MEHPMEGATFSPVETRMLLSYEKTSSSSKWLSCLNPGIVRLSPQRLPRMSA